MIKDLPLNERPREKMINIGSKKLSNTELLAILIQTGSKSESSLALAQKILELMNNGIHELNNMTVQELCQIKGIGPSKAVQILAAVELANRIKMDEFLIKEKIMSPKDIYDIVGQDMKYFKKEVFRVVFLDTKNRVIDYEDISMGSLNSSIVHPREVFNRAVKKSAAGIVLMHNHPSGNPTPSSEDINITKRLAQAGELLGIKVMDHVIIGIGKYYSMREENLM
ncbi:MAG: DNA repair protein RadC [Clostridiales bacterium]|nr:DNA repair protein RadC [Clostridiales bacterium]